MIKLLLCILSSFVLTVAVMPLVIKLCKRLKFGQTILHYVDNHQAKNGTPTMGGIGFIPAAAATACCFLSGEKTLAIMVLAVTLGYGVVGFLDDFIKIRFHRNEGLSVWQKIVFQGLIAVIVSVFAYNSGLVGDAVYVPFVLREIHLGVFALPLYIFVFIAFTNAVNLTDGLDGLAGSVTAVYLFFMAAVVALAAYYLGMGQATAEPYNMLVVMGALIGALVGFLCYNGYPAKIFMGDTGALALGGAVASLAVVTKQSLLAPIVGVMYVLTCLSDVIQVVHYKRTKKRVFVMAPLHHHFERKGVHESKIVRIYASVTMAMGLVTMILVLALN